jgi:two-component system, OmpR family, response regulator CpxR
MLVEDDFVLRAHLAELIMYEGYTVSCAADGAEALRRLEKEPPPSVILTDIILPRVDGSALRTVQLQTPALRDIPTIALTSLRDTASLRDLRFAEIMTKPVDIDHLIEVLAKLCARA